MAVLAIVLICLTSNSKIDLANNINHKIQK